MTPITPKGGRNLCSPATGSYSLHLSETDLFRNSGSVPSPSKNKE